MKLDWYHQVLVLVSLKVKSRREKLLGGEHVQGGGGEESSLCVALLPFTAFIYMQRGGWTYGGGGGEGGLHVFPPCSATPSPGCRGVGGGRRDGRREADGGEPLEM